MKKIEDSQGVKKEDMNSEGRMNTKKKENKGRKMKTKEIIEENEVHK